MPELMERLAEAEVWGAAPGRTAGRLDEPGTGGACGAGGAGSEVRPWPVAVGRDGDHDGRHPRELRHRARRRARGAPVNEPVILAVALALSIGPRGRRGDHRRATGLVLAAVVLPMVAVGTNETSTRIFSPDRHGQRFGG